MAKTKTTTTTEPTEGIRQCIGSVKFGIDAHDAPVADFPLQPYPKDGLGRMCRPHWKEYTSALRRASAPPEEAPASVPHRGPAARSGLSLSTGVIGHGEVHLATWADCGACGRQGGDYAPAMSGHRIDVNGLRTYYQVQGSGAPLLLLHGGLCSAETFDAMIPALAERFQVLGPERRGHGRTPDTDEPFTYDAMAVETVAFMDTLGIPSAHIVGHSDGGNIGLLVAIRNPNRVGRVVSIGGNFHPSGIAKEPSRPRAAVKAQFDALRDDFRRLSPDGPEHLEVINQKSRSLWWDWPGIELDDLRTIQAPVLVMAGDADGIHIEHTVQLFEALPNGQLAIVPNAGHFLIREQSDLVDELVLGFLQESSATS